jgi:hypothetical protein
MTDAAARLAALDREDLVAPWEVDEAPVVDPSRLEEGEADRIAEAVKDEAWHDPGRYPEGFWALFAFVRVVAEPGGSREWVEREATQVLRRIQRRILAGEEQIKVNRHG